MYVYHIYVTYQRCQQRIPCNTIWQILESSFSIFTQHHRLSKLLQQYRKKIFGISSAIHMYVAWHKSANAHVLPKEDTELNPAPCYPCNTMCFHTQCLATAHCANATYNLRGIYNPPCQRIIFERGDIMCCNIQRQTIKYFMKKLIFPFATNGWIPAAR